MTHYRTDPSQVVRPCRLHLAGPGARSRGPLIVARRPGDVAGAGAGVARRRRHRPPAIEWLFFKGGMSVVLVLGLVAFALIARALGHR